jgi:aryl-alcohol dehydrogenase-like predicted oxidoreductase
MGRTGRAASLHALESAFDHGVNVFDVARSYGYGEAEALLGEFLRGKRDRAVVITKFGIQSAPQSRWQRALKPIARRFLRNIPSLRRAVRSRIAAEFHPDQFSIPALRASFEQSLRQLRTDHVDVLLAHAAPVSILQQDDLLAAMERLVSDGKVRVVGVSGDRALIDAALTMEAPAVAALQFPANLIVGIPPALPMSESRLTMANQPFGGVEGVAATRARIEQIRNQVPPLLREKLATIDRETIADVVLSLLLRGSSIDMVVASMMAAENLRANLNALERSRFSDAEVEQLRAALRPN